MVGIKTVLHKQVLLDVFKLGSQSIRSIPLKTSGLWLKSFRQALWWPTNVFPWTPPMGNAATVPAHKQRSCPSLTEGVSRLLAARAFCGSKSKVGRTLHPMPPTWWKATPSSICTSSSFPLPWPGLHNEKLWNQFLFILNELKVFVSWLPGAAGFHAQLEVRSQVPHSFWRLEFPSFGTLATGGILNEARLALLAWEELLLFTSPRIYPQSHGQNENPRSISWLLASHPPSSWTFKSGNYDGNLGP